VLTDIRVETLKRYGIETALAPRFPDKPLIFLMRTVSAYGLLPVRPVVGNALISLNSVSAYGAARSPPYPLCATRRL
jgi:hypothetical protein